ncbi:sporozoite surface protein 2-like [Ruditapes philippinarum]|uniref:sporozoite surface protein 2-like n=1 Tax=Ruditapes philippinarum TaxID=129788 RepID=UPI00295B1CC0|nr:sporozoite surface protein 2-like [Ruditapes philippinarum]
MNIFVVVCFVLGCSLSTYATYHTRTYAGNQQTCCTDYLGRRIRPGQNYFDGCNTCICGQAGVPSICTLRYCGPTDVNTGRTSYGGAQVLPTIPVDPVPPVRPINPSYNVNPMAPVRPINPSYNVNPMAPVRPINPSYNVNPMAPVSPTYPPYQTRRY